MGRSVVFLGNQIPMPCQQSLRCDYGGELGQHLPSQHLSLNSQSPVLIVIEAQSPIAELLAKHPGRRQYLTKRSYHSINILVSCS